MKWKQMLHYEIAAVWRPVAAFYGIMIAIFILGSILRAMLSQTALNFGDPDVMSSVFVFVIGFCLYKEPFFMGLANGISRRTSFLCFLILSVSLSLVVAICNSVLLPIFSHVVSFQITDIIYGELEMGAWMEQIVRLVISIVMSVMFMQIGYTIGGVYYRMGKVLKGIVSACVPIFFVLLLPIIFTALPEHIQQAIGRFFAGIGTFIASTPWNLVLVFSGVSLLFAVLGWLLIRRSPIKA